MKARRRRDRDTAAELPLTPMIDVVFLLLIFFLWTLPVRDTFAHLDAMRPSGQATGKRAPMLRVTVLPEGFRLNERAMTGGELDRALAQLGELDPGMTVLLLVSEASPHARLIEALDLCAKSGLGNLSVLTLR